MCRNFNTSEKIKISDRNAFWLNVHAAIFFTIVNSRATGSTPANFPQPFLYSSSTKCIVQSRKMNKKSFPSLPYLTHKAFVVVTSF